MSEREDNAPPPLVETASWGYVRLRLENYYAKTICVAGPSGSPRTAWQTMHVYFMHEPTAPAYAQTLMKYAA